MGRRRARARAHTAGAARIAVVALALAAGACGHGSSATARAEVGKRAPTFVAPRIVGPGDVRLTDYRGKPVLLNFFASWCEPCRDELPLLQRTAADGRIAVVAVLFNDSTANARKFLQQIHVTLPAVDDDGSIARAYRVAFKPGLPMSYLISRDGVVVDRHIGQLQADDVTAWVKKAA